MVKKTNLLFYCCFTFSGMFAQVKLPLIVDFKDATSKSAAKRLLNGPWDNSLRCDGLDTMRFLPTCCSNSQIVPFLGISPYQFYCENRQTYSGGDYLSIIRNYDWNGVKTTVCDSLTILGPKIYISKDSIPIIKVLGSKNNFKFKYQTWPKGPVVTMPSSADYTALEVSLVDDLGNNLKFTDTLEFIEGFNWKISDPSQFSVLNDQVMGRFKFRLLGEGDLGIDEFRFYYAPKIYTTIIESCNGNDGKISIDSIIGFTPPLVYQWSNGSNQDYIDSLSTGNYSLIVEDSKGQMAKRDFFVGTSLKLAIDSIISIDSSGIAGEVFLSYGGAKVVNWLWKSPLGFISTIEKPKFLIPSKYNLTVMDSSGCVASTNIPVSVKCNQICTPRERIDTICLGNLPKVGKLPFSSIIERYWISLEDTVISNSLSLDRACENFTPGWNQLIIRWVDTINKCIGSVGSISVFVRPNPSQPSSVNWVECPNNLGFIHTWKSTNQKERLYWRKLSQENWMNYSVPNLSAIETKDSFGYYTWVGKYKDTLSGCFSDTTHSTYQISPIYKTSLIGTKSYTYGLTSTLRVNGVPNDVSKHYSISYGGKFEMLGSNGSVHPCHGKSECECRDTELVVRHSTIPCWSPPRVISTVKILNTYGACDSLSKFYVEDTGYYDCFGTQLLKGDTLIRAVQGKPLVLKVATTSGYHVIDNPLHISYANCDYFLPYQWQIMQKDSTQWLPISELLDSNYSTKTDTNLIYLIIPRISPKLEQCKIRLRVESCKDNWSISSTQIVRFEENINEHLIFPNPTSSEFIIQSFDDCEVKIYDIFGYLQFKGITNDYISIKDWKEGVYLVQLEDGNSKKSALKLIVVH